MAELDDQIVAANEEHKAVRERLWQLERERLLRDYGKFVGCYFKYETRTSSGDTWFVYIFCQRQDPEDGRLHGVEFQHVFNGDIRFETAEWFAESTLARITKITREEFDEAYRAGMQAAAAAAGIEVKF
jgi:hypothetical protein